MHDYKRTGSFVVVVTAIFLAVVLLSSNPISFQKLHNYIRTNENDSGFSYEAEQANMIKNYTKIEPLTLDEEFNDDVADFILENEGSDQDSRNDPFVSQNAMDVDRRLAPYAVSEYLYPLPCNEGVSFDCTTTPLSSLSVPASGPLVIECGTCVYVDITDGQQFNLDNGLRIEGKLYFPPEASVTISTIYVMVLGILKMDNPLVGNQVKFHLKGEVDQYFVASDKQDPAMTSKCMGIGCKIGKKAIAVVGGQLDIQGIDPDCPSWEQLLNLSTETESDDATILNKIHLSQKAAECWTPGSEILVTSSDEYPTNYQVATIDTTDHAAGTLKLTSPINPVSTMATKPKYAVEVALLNRRIVFEADDDTDDDLIGGHLIILLTPSVKQHLEGVEIRNFGQQGNLGRYPVHFHLCDDGFGSIVRKNVVRQSNQRCYVMHGTNGVLIEDNVAFDTFGHCFMTEDGVEHSNRFVGNLGAHIKNAINLVSEQSKRKETDTEASIFWMTNMENFFEGNVAAGSETNGYWVETHFSMEGRGGSIYQRPDHKPVNSNLGSFKDNVAHSIRGTGFLAYPPGWSPIERAIIENLRIYRGGNMGVFLHNNRNLSFIGGYIAQVNYVGIRVFSADDIIIDGVEFIGNIEGEPKQCKTRREHKAVLISPHRMPTRGDTKNEHFGTKMKNVIFSDWEPQENCDDPLVDVNIIQIRRPGWDAYALMENVVHDGTNPQIVSACRYQNAWSHDAAIEVSSDATGVYGEPGFLVGSLNVPLSGKQCTDVGGCLFFCPGLCLRTIKFRTSSGHDMRGYKMKVSDGIQTVTIDRYYSNFGGDTLAHKYTETSFFSISLPAGSFTIWFEEESNPGVMVYPNFVYPFFEAEPTCSDYVTAESLTILKPPSSEPRCDNLVRNGDFTSDIDGWQEFKADYFYSESAGIDGSGALVTRQTKHYSMVVQWLDISCLVDNAGVYLFQAYYRYVDQVDDLDNAQDVSSPEELDIRLVFDTASEEEQKLHHLSNSWALPVAYPTESPTQSPITPTAPTIEPDQPELAKLGNNWSPEEVFPLGNCEGDCDRDSDCQFGLLCFKRRNSYAPIPGCGGEGRSDTDYCYNPLADSPNRLGIISNAADSPLGMCKGHCDSDSDCQSGLVCMQRNGNEVVLGCGGVAESTRNYCYDPALLVNVGNTKWKGTLAACQGDCDKDSHCQDGLLCMQRRGDELVPGCHGGGINGMDYCYDPNPPPSVYYNIVASEGQPLGKCEGDCVSDSDCQIGLVCMQRNDNEPVPGCGGTPVSGKGYCYESDTSQNGFKIVTAMFEITTEQAAATAARLELKKFPHGVIFDKISMVKAPWSQTN